MLSEWIKKKVQSRQKYSLQKHFFFLPILNSFSGYIDLSKRRVSPEDVEKCTDRFSKAKAVNSILRHVAELLKFESDAQLEKLYQQTAWLHEDKTKKKASAYDFFKQAVQYAIYILKKVYFYS